MKRTKKYTANACQQKSGINNITLLRILAFLKEYVKYILIALLITEIAIKIGEFLGKWLAYNI